MGDTLEISEESSLKHNVTLTPSQFSNTLSVVANTKSARVILQYESIGAEFTTTLKLTYTNTPAQTTANVTRLAPHLADSTPDQHPVWAIVLLALGVLLCVAVVVLCVYRKQR